MNLREIARLCGASHMLDDQSGRVEPAGFSIDSRAIRAGELFIAVPGERVDGHQFLHEVFEKGASAALVVHKRLPFMSGSASWNRYANRLLFVENTVCALQQMAARVLAAWHRPIIGVTGSAGKTTMKDLTALVLSAVGRVLKSQGNFNTGYGLPLSIGHMITAGAKPSDFDFAVLEMGMSSFGEIARLTDIAPPSVGLVGNVGAAHLEFFGGLEAVARAKAEMIDGIKTGATAILNGDDPLVIKMRERRSDLSVVTFAIEAQADVMALAVEVDGDLSGTRFTLATPDGRASVKFPLIGLHNVYNALAAAAVAYNFGLSPELIAGQLASARPSKMRGELIRFANGVTIIDDSYNSNPQALIHAVRAMLDAGNFKRRIVVAGEMLELGMEAGQLHRQCGRQIAALKIDRLIGVRGLAQELVAGAKENGMKSEQAVFCETPEEAAERLIAERSPGDLVLVKGSRGVRTERVVERLRADFGMTVT